MISSLGRPRKARYLPPRQSPSIGIDNHVRVVSGPSYRGQTPVPIFQSRLLDANQRQISCHGWRLPSFLGVHSSAFIQDQLEPLPRPSCLICNRASRAAAAESATRQPCCVFRSAARQRSERPSSYRNRLESTFRACLTSYVAIQADPTSTGAPSNSTCLCRKPLLFCPRACSCQLRRFVLSAAILSLRSLVVP